MKFELTIEGKLFKLTNKKSYNAHLVGAEMIEWLKANNNDYEGAAVVFDYCVRTIKRKITSLGYKPAGLFVLDRATVEKAIIIHMNGGDILGIADDYGQSKDALTARMRVFGYSTVTKSFSLDKPRKAKLANRLDTLWEKILYNAKLSYNADFEMHDPFILR